MSRLGCSGLLVLAAASCTDGGQPRPARALLPDDPSAAAPAALRETALVPVGALRTRLPERAAEGFAVGDAASGLTIDVRLEGAGDVSAEHVEASRIFRDALPGADHVLSPSDTGLEDHLRFAAPPPRSEVRYVVTLGAAVAGLRLVGGLLEVLDGGGAPRLRVRAPALFEAGGVRRDLDLSVRGCAVDTSPRLPWGRAPTPPGAGSCTVVVRWSAAGLRYPIVVDPVWELTTDMAQVRWRHAATLLPGDRVLVAGGQDDNSLLLASAEVYDLTTKTWAATGVMAEARRSAGTLSLEISAAMPAGGALITGGRASTPETVTAGCEIYDADAGTWSAAGTLGTGRSHHAAVMLDDDTVLVAGGYNDGIELASAERSTTDLSQWNAAGTMPQAHFGAAAARLDDGTVIVAGGHDVDANVAQASTAVFDGSGWAAGPLMTTPRSFFPMARLSDGRLLAAAGATQFGLDSSAVTTLVDVYEPATGWTATEPLPEPRYNGTATELANGLVLLHGGQHGGATAAVDTVYDTSLLWDPVAGTWSPGGTGVTRRSQHSATRFDGGAVLVAGGEDGDGLFDPLTSSAELWTLTDDGQPCTDAQECTSGHCVEGICCDASCDGVCRSCLGSRTGGADGTCTPVVEGADANNECLDSGAGQCGDNGVCDGAGACQQYPASTGCEPAPCSSGEECASGFCADGICCASACDGECRSCLESANGVADGQCLPIAKGTDPEAECADNGTTDCSKVTLCDGNGACVGSNVVCAPYTCLDVDECKTSCVVDADCLPTHRCDDGACVPRVSSCEGDIFVDPDGDEDDCAPYGCDPANPSCRTSCQSAEDCADGFVCDSDGQCVGAPSAGGDDGDDGCGCRTAGAASRGGALHLAAVMLGLAAAAARRRPTGRHPPRRRASRATRPGSRPRPRPPRRRADDSERSSSGALRKVGEQRT